MICIQFEISLATVILNCKFHNLGYTKQILEEHRKILQFHEKSQGDKEDGEEVRVHFLGQAFPGYASGGPFNNLVVFHAMILLEL